MTAHTSRNGNRQSIVFDGPASVETLAPLLAPLNCTAAINDRGWLMIKNERDITLSIVFPGDTLTFYGPDWRRQLDIKLAPGNSIGGAR